MNETHTKDIYAIPDYYTVIIDNIMTNENPRYHTNQVLYCSYKNYTIDVVFCNKGNEYYCYELKVNFSDPKFYEIGDPRKKPLPPMYETTWDRNESMLLFFKEYKTMEDSANDVNYWLSNAKEFEESLLENCSGFDTNINNDKNLERIFINAFTINQFKEQQFEFIQIFDNKQLNTANYKVFEFKKENNLYHIALNNHKPYFALLKDFRVSNLVCEFYDVPINPSYALQGIAFGIPTDILEWKLEQPYINRLSEMELKQIKYWKASTIGEFLFNKWD
jgi:hypothetical protein